MLASSQGHIDVVRFLLRKGAAVNVLDNVGHPYSIPFYVALTALVPREVGVLLISLLQMDFHVLLSYY